jgi:hypothetical protein
MGAVFTPLDVAAERPGATNLYGRHDATLGEAQMPFVGDAPGCAMSAKDVGEFQLRLEHNRRFSFGNPPCSGVRADFELVG